MGLNKVKEIADTLAALNIRLSEEEVSLLEEPYLPRALIGHA
jgi:aryl-alcohol dehydrogenase-like predicted oxidoreductase